MGTWLAITVQGWRGAWSGGKGGEIFCLRQVTKCALFSESLDECSNSSGSENGEVEIVTRKKVKYR